jgi:hypothetical protein
MAELERAGVPTVAMVANSFEKQWRGNAAGFGVRELPNALLARPLVGLEPADIMPHVEAVYDKLVQALTGSSAKAGSQEETGASERMAIEGADAYDAVRNMNRLFLERGWSDGFPLWAPTRRDVDAMLAGTRKLPDHVITVLEPGNGIATVEKIAINAVMAGCLPEHLPVLIAAVEAISDPRFLLRAHAQSTGCHAPLMLVNGPIAKQLNINSGRCALGPGSQSYANSVLGRALRLIYMNVGHAYPGIMDMDTLGSPTKYSMCLAENEDASPWEPYHVEKGFDKDQSVVTVQSTYGLSEIEDNFGTTPEAIMDTICSNACSRGIKNVGYWLQGWRADPITRTQVQEKEMLILGPVHATTFQKHGWSKQTVKEYLYKRARMPFGELIANLSAPAFRKSHPELLWLFDSPKSLLPIVETADCFEVVVAGALGGARSTFSFGSAGPISKVIDA